MSEPITAEYRHNYHTPEELANDAAWMPFITDAADRLAAATAYMSTPVVGLGQKAAKRAKRAAVFALPFVADATDHHNARFEEERHQSAADAAAQHAQLVENARLPLGDLLAMALRHTEVTRFFNAGNWTRKHWVQERREAGPFFEDRSLIHREANADAYTALVSILGRRSTNLGGGRRQDVTEETKTDAARLRLARDIIAGRNVSAARLMSITDMHARAWAVERCGGWDKLASRAKVHQKTADGTLLDGRSIGLGNDLLVVRCPTTRRKYVLHVPRPKQDRYRTVARALKAVNGIEAAKIVAHS